MPAFSLFFETKYLLKAAEVSSKVRFFSISRSVVLLTFKQKTIYIFLHPVCVAHNV